MLEDKQNPIGPKIRISHPGAILFEIFNTLSGLIEVGSIDLEGSDDLVDLAGIKTHVPRFDPLSASFVFGTKNLFSFSPQILLRMKQIKNLGRMGEVLTYNILNPVGFNSNGNLRFYLPKCRRVVSGTRLVVNMDLSLWISFDAALLIADE